MKKFALFIVGISLGVHSFSTAIEREDFEFSGHVLGGASMIRQENRETTHGSRTGFDYAVNLDLGFKIDEKLSGFLSLQTSPGDGHLGFPGPGTELTDAHLIYHYHSRSVFTMGSFDLPFGRQSAYLTNNANSYSSWFLANDLLYSALAGPFGTLNTVGVKGEYSHALGDGRVVVSNGTDESAKNSDSGFLVLVGVESEKMVPGMTVGASAFQVDERGDVSGNGLGTELSAVMIDVSRAFSHGIDMRAYLAFLNFGDDQGSTQDGVSTWMVEAKKSFNTTFLSARLSAWIPNDGNGSGTGVSLDMPHVGFGITQGDQVVLTDQTVLRLQLGAGHYLEKHVLLRAEAIWDDYTKKSGGENTDTFSVLAFVNVAL